MEVLPPCGVASQQRCHAGVATVSCLLRCSGMTTSGENSRTHGRTAAGVRLCAVVENGEYLLQNKGDLAMLAVTVRRLRERWPDGEIGVMTNAPALLRAYEPEAVPIRFDQGRSPRNVGLPTPPLPLRVAGTVLDLTEGVLSLERRVSNRLRRYMPNPRSGWEEKGHASAGWQPVLRRDGGRVPDAVENAALIIAMGGGYLTDADLLQSHRTLTLLDYGVRQGIPTVMLGQGLGPMTDEGLLAHAGQVLPMLNLIALREQRRGPEILHSFGVPDDNVIVTGDDAIELGYEVRAPAVTDDLGVCLRISGYSAVTAGQQAGVGNVVRTWARAMNVGVRPLIVSEYLSEDRRATLPLTAGYGKARKPLSRFARPIDLAREVGQCRVVVTGAYHVAVFALAQGIPVVGLSASEYYDDKMAGLASMFKLGIEVVRIDAEGLAWTLDEAMARAWGDAEEVRAPLLLRAEEQIALSRSAFDRACRLAER